MAHPRKCNPLKVENISKIGAAQAVGDVVMSRLDGLARCAGTWRGTNRLQDPHTGKPEESASVVTIAPILGGRFIRFDYTWSYQGAPQEGALLFGAEAKASIVTAHWID